MKRKIATLALSSIIALSSLSTAFAGTWIQDHVGWWYQNNDGSYPTNGWHWIDGNNDGNAECYYFDSIGYCLTNTSTPDGYLVDLNGAWIVDGVVQTKATVIAPSAVVSANVVQFTAPDSTTESNSVPTAIVPSGIAPTTTIPSSVMMSTGITEASKPSAVVNSIDNTWPFDMPFISGMTKEKPVDGFFITVNVDSGVYHFNQDVWDLSEKNTRYFTGSVDILENYGYRYCRRKNCG